MKYFKMHLFVFVILFFSLSACENKIDADELLRSAASFKASHNYNAAIIQVKKVINEDSENLEAREMLADIYLLLGKNTQAEKEYRRTIAIGGLNANRMRGLGSSLIRQSKYNSLDTESTFQNIVDKKLKSTLLVLLGDRALVLGQANNAIVSYTGALQLTDNDASALIGVAKIHIQLDNFLKAEEYIARLKNAAGTNMHEMLYVEGVSHFKQDNIKDALHNFEVIASSIKNNSVSLPQFMSFINIISIYLQGNNVEEASAATKRLLSIVPNHPLPQYYDALIKFKNKNYEAAYRGMQKVIKSAPDFVPGIFLMGVSNYALGNYEQANELLSQFVNLNPTHLQARKLLGATRIKLERHQSALDVLSPALEDNTEDANLLAMAGVAAVSIGDSQRAAQFFENASSASPENNLIREALARIYLQQGDFDKAIEKLSGASDTDAKHRLLVGTYVKKGQFNEAINYTRKLIAASPGKPKYSVLLALTYLHKGDRSNSKRILKKTLKSHPEFTPSYLLFARLELESGNLSLAERTFQQLLAREQHNIHAMLGMAQIEEIRNNQKNAIGWLKKAVENNKNNILPYIILGKYYLKINKNKQALELALKASDLNEDINTMIFLATAYAKNKKYSESISIYEKLYKEKAGSIPISMLYASVLLESNNTIKAKALFKKVISLNKQYIAAYVGLINIELRNKNLAKALAWCEKLENEFSGKSVAFEIRGDVYLNLGDPGKAVEQYIIANKKGPSEILDVKLSKAYSALGDRQNSLNTLVRANKIYPKSQAVLLNLANAYQAHGKLVEARHHYNQFLVKNPEHVIVLNNLAYTYMDDEPGEALSLAQQAYALAPDSHAVIDTLGWALIKSGNPKQGTEYLSSIRGKTKNHSIKYHLAVGLSKTGQIDDAKQVLQSLVDSSVDFPERSLAVALLKKL